MQLLHSKLWRGEGPTTVAHPSLASGYPELDTWLPDQGWPVGMLIEIQLAHPGTGEFQLMAPVLAHPREASDWVACITPPHLPYPPALMDRGLALQRMLLIRTEDHRSKLWAAEQALRSKACAIVMCWVDQPDERALRRLQLAAEAGLACAIVFRTDRTSHSPAAIRLAIEPLADGRLQVRILKRRGNLPLAPLLLDVNHALALPRPAAPQSGPAPARRKRR